MTQHERIHRTEMKMNRKGVPAHQAHIGRVRKILGERIAPNAVVLCGSRIPYQDHRSIQQDSGCKRWSSGMDSANCCDRARGSGQTDLSKNTPSLQAIHTRFVCMWSLIKAQLGGYWRLGLREGRPRRLVENMSGSIRIATDAVTPPAWGKSR
jgi:hypothetical protein